MREREPVIPLSRGKQQQKIPVWHVPGKLKEARAGGTEWERAGGKNLDQTGCGVRTGRRED